MCGRIGQYLPSAYLEAFFRIDQRFLENREAYYNAPPTTDLMVVRIDPATGKRAIAVMKWGLVPWFSKTGKMDYSTFNAKCEGVEKAASFREPFKARRCIVPADLYYEWKKLGPTPKNGKQPYAVARADGTPLLFAGLWDAWKSPEGNRLLSFTILTTAPLAGSKMSELHNRIPVVLAAESVPVWLGEEPGGLAPLMRPCPDEWLRMWKVSARVGNVKNNDATLIEEVE
jgi:putative SOS response-associated peptidase YedK